MADAPERVVIEYRPGDEWGRLWIDADRTGETAAPTEGFMRARYIRIDLMVERVVDAYENGEQTDWHSALGYDEES